MCKYIFRELQIQVRIRLAAESCILVKWQPLKVQFFPVLRLPWKHEMTASVLENRPVNFFRDVSHLKIATLCFRLSRTLLSSTPKIPAANKICEWSVQNGINFFMSSLKILGTSVTYGLHGCSPEDGSNTPIYRCENFKFYTTDTCTVNCHTVLLGFTV
jgi:hypothetical protein